MCLDSGCKCVGRKILSRHDVMRRLRGQCEDTSMKALAILPVAAAAVMALNFSTAFSQGACQKEYQACMDDCAGRSSKGLQDSCFTSCEGKNNICAERIYGKRPLNGSPSTAAAPKSGATDALAKEPAEPPAAAEPQQAPAAEPRTPARRQNRR
jgi:hypothetical protein